METRFEFKQIYCKSSTREPYQKKEKANHPFYHRRKVEKALFIKNSLLARFQKYSSEYELGKYSNLPEIGRSFSR